MMERMLCPSFRWPSYAELRLPEPSQHVEPGLSSYADSPKQAGQSLLPLLDFAYKQVCMEPNG